MGARAAFGAWRALAGLVLAVTASYVLWPCTPWARDDAALIGAERRAALAAGLTARCDTLGVQAAARWGYTCWADTESAELPLVPRACAQCSHRTLRLHVAPLRMGRPALPDLGPAAVAPELLAAHWPPDAGDTTPGADVWARLRASGFTQVEIVRDYTVIARLPLVPAPGPPGSQRP